MKILAFEIPLHDQLIAIVIISFITVLYSAKILIEQGHFENWKEALIPFYSYFKHKK